MSQPGAARLTIDLDALVHNYRVIAAEAAGAETAPVVKADGYGLGAGMIGRRLWRAGARSFFVARLSEGEALRAALTAECPAAIYVLDGLTAETGARLAAAQLTPVLSTLAQVAAAGALSARAGRLEVALQVDSGMNRQGLGPGEAAALAAAPDRLANLDVALVMSHLGSATNPSSSRNFNQLQSFHDVRALFPQARASLAASAGAFLGPDYRFDMVRPGVSLYGGGPFERPDPRLKAVAALTAPILDIRDLQPGDIAGYGESVVISRPTRVAIVAAGYADGLIRAGKAGGYGWLEGRRCPYLFINMDLAALDIGDAPARSGQTVELLGPNALLDDLATAAGTVAHEVLVRISARAERVYMARS